VVSSTPRPYFTPGKDPVPIVQEAGWAPGPVWTGAENLAPTGIRSPDRPARSQSLYRLNYPAHTSDNVPCQNKQGFNQFCSVLISTLVYTKKTEQKVFKLRWKLTELLICPDDCLCLLTQTFISDSQGAILILGTKL
jgi:hypothetical protein